MSWRYVHSHRWKLLRGLIGGKEGTSGSALVEFTIFGPMLVAMAIYTMDFGLLAVSRMEVQYAAQAGAQWAIGQTNYDASSIASAVTNATTFTSINPSSSQFCGCVDPNNGPAGVNHCAATCDLCNGGVNTNTCVLGNYVKVTATPNTPYKPLIRYGITSATYDLTATATVRIR
jgi:Flp pilus assembly protein TadG